MLSVVCNYRQDETSTKADTKKNKHYSTNPELQTQDSFEATHIKFILLPI